MARIFIDDTSQFRLREYRAAWQIIKIHFFIGVGSGQQLLHYPRVFLPDYQELANNMVLQVFIDLGLIGLALLSGLVYSFYINIRKILTHKTLLSYGFVAAVIAATLNGLVEVTFFVVPYAVMFWLTAGVFSNIKQYDFRNHD